MSHYKQASMVFFLVIVGLFVAFPVSGLQMVQFPLKPSPASGPYQDEDFLRMANTTIYSLSNETVPNGTALYDLQTTQQKMAKMNISPELHLTASLINDFLYYTGKAGYEYNEVQALVEKPYSPLYDDKTLTNDAMGYYRDAKRVWEKISDRYPGVNLYTMPVIDRKSPFSVNEDDSRVFPRGTPTLSSS